MIRQPAATPVPEDSAYRAIFEASSDGLVINDVETGLVLEANPAFCRMHGYTDMRGLHPTQFIHPNSHGLFHEYLRTVGEGREFRARAQDVRQDGSIFDVEVLGRGFDYQGKFALLGVVRDVTDQVRAMQDLEDRVALRTREIERRRRVAEGLRDLLATINSTGTLDETLPAVLGQACSLLSSDASAIYVPDPDHSDRLRVAASLQLDEEYASSGAIVGVPVTGLAFSGRRSVAVYDVETALCDLDEYELQDLASHLRVMRMQCDFARATGGVAFAGHRGVLSIPLEARDETYGCLTLLYREPQLFSDDDIWLATAFADQAALAIQNAQLHQRAQQVATLEERQRLARELHDAVTQTLFSTALIAEVIPDLWEIDPGEGRQRLADLRRLTRGALAEMRTLLIELRPGALTEMTLADLLRQLTEATAGRTRLDVTLQVSGTPTSLAPPVQVALYRIAQEALTNVVRHASAGSAAILLEYCSNGGIQLRVRDDGSGFDAHRQLPGHLGLSIMRERAESIGARLHVSSRSGEGTTIDIEWGESEDACS